MKAVLKPPGSMLFKLEYDEQLSNFAFKFNLRRYSKDIRNRKLQTEASRSVSMNESPFPNHLTKSQTARRSSSLVGRCRLNLSNPR